MPQTIKALKALAADSPHASPALSSQARAGAHARREVRRAQKEWLRRSWRVQLVIAGMGAALVVLTHFLAPAIPHRRDRRLVCLVGLHIDA